MNFTIESLEKGQQYPFSLEFPSEVIAQTGRVLSAEKLPLLFTDSTHQVWRLQTAKKTYALKLCPADLLQQELAIFWQGMRHLWQVDLPEQLGDFAEVYGFLAKYAGLKVPELIAASSRDGAQPAWLLTTWEAGQSIVQPSSKQITQLAEHLANLHQQQRQYFGGLVGKVLPLVTWGEQLVKTLEFLAERQQVVLPWSPAHLQSLRAWTPKACVPVMMDLRWDQFLQSEQADLQVLVDCDAFVWAPAGLALLQVASMLSANEWLLFRGVYEAHCPWPEDMQGEYQEALLVLLKLLQVFGTEPIRAFARC